jgi:sulfur carrier protein ThiS adenylyltransferase
LTVDSQNQNNDSHLTDATAAINAKRGFPMSFSFDSVTSHYFSPAQLARIRQTRIGIAGAGGLGSNCAVNLVRCGFEDFTIVDFDKIEPSNLNRQSFFSDQIGTAKVTALAENLRRINPALQLTMHQLRLDQGNLAEIFADCNAVVEAFDNPVCKAMVAQAFARSQKLLVCASGLAGFGDSDRITTRRIHERFYIVGDQRSEVSGDVKPYAPCVAIAAAKQADVVLSWVLRE